MIAHIRKDENGYAEQSVQAHCQETASLCAGYAASVGAEHIARLQGLLHDAGKLTSAFERYIRQGSDCRRGEIDHSFAGAKYLYALAEQSGDANTDAAARLICRTILSHHGIHDWLNGDQDRRRRRQHINGNISTHTPMRGVTHISTNTELTCIFQLTRPRGA